MAGPAGALAATFKITRALQIASLLAIIGMTANFISEMVNANATPPRVLVGTLSIVGLPLSSSAGNRQVLTERKVCIAVLYCAITVILFLDNILPHLASTGIDGLFLIALVVVAVVIGKPISYLDCKVLNEVSNTSSSAFDFTSALGSALSKDGGRVVYSQWIGTSKATCYEVKSIWGLSIALWYVPSPSNSHIS